jgi:asparagine N-glycosylation enzyme membrane subunit Stt3
MGTNQGAFIATFITLSTVLGLLGLLLLWNEQRRSLATLFLLCITLFPLPYYITHAEVRFRLVLEPVMTLLASYAAAKLLSARTGSTASMDR